MSTPAVPRRLHCPPMTGNQLRAFLRERDIPQREAAEWIGVSLRAMQRWCGFGSQQVPRFIEYALKYATQIMGR